MDDQDTREEEGGGVSEWIGCVIVTTRSLTNNNASMYVRTFQHRGGGDHGGEVL